MGKVKSKETKVVKGCNNGYDSIINGFPSLCNDILWNKALNFIKLIGSPCILWYNTKGKERKEQIRDKEILVVYRHGVKFVLTLTSDRAKVVLLFG